MLSITEQFKQDVKKKAKKLAATVLVPVICITVLIGGLYNSPFAIFFPSRDDASTSNNKSLISYIKSKYSETVHMMITTVELIQLRRILLEVICKAFSRI